MSRPLIIKVDTHKVKPSPRAAGLTVNGSQILKQMHFDNPQPEDEQLPKQNGLKSSSLVRNLISQYESGAESPLETTALKYKSRSLMDLQKPKTEPEIKTQDDYFLDRKKYKEDKDEDTKEEFNFQKVFSMFKNLDRGVTPSPKLTQSAKIPTYKKTQIKTEVPKDSVDIKVIKQKAFLLLQSQPSFDRISYDFSWQSKVINLLEDITTIQAVEVTVPEPPLANRKYFDDFDPHQRQDSVELAYKNQEENEEDNNSYVEGDRILTKPTIIYAEEDGVPRDHVVENGELDQGNQSQDQLNDEEDDFSDTASSGTMQSVSPTLDEQNRLDYVESCKQLLEDLVKDVREYESQMKWLSADNESEGQNIRKVLEKIVEELRDVRIDHNEELLLVKREDAINYATKCIEKLVKLQPALSS